MEDILSMDNMLEVTEIDNIFDDNYQEPDTDNQESEEKKIVKEALRNLLK